jgi:hypothetical protein
MQEDSCIEPSFSSIDIDIRGYCFNELRANDIIKFQFHRLSTKEFHTCWVLDIWVLKACHMPYRQNISSWVIPK